MSKVQARKIVAISQGCAAKHAYYWPTITNAPLLIIMIPSLGLLQDFKFSI